MKQIQKRGLALLLAIVMAVGAAASAYAAFDFPDAQNHWARATLEKAYDAGLIEGFEDGTLRPNNPITTAEMITLLCRVLNATEKADTSALNIPAGAWYADAAAKALYLELIDSSTGNLNAPLNRQKALIMLSNAFQLDKAAPDLAKAARYSDFGTLSAQDARIIASLIEDGYVQGYNGSLTLSSSITRAEFLTFLYRVVDSYLNAADIPFETNANIMLRDSAPVSSCALSGNLWTSCAGSNVNLIHVSAGRVTVRTEQLDALSLSGTKIDRLVLANMRGDVRIPSFGSSSIGTLAIGAGHGSVSIQGLTKHVEINGSGRSVNISTPLSTLYIAGDNNTVTVSGNVGTVLVISGSNNKVTFSGGADAEASVTGSGNTVTIPAGSTMNAVTVKGDNNTLTGGGRIETLTVKSKSTTVNVTCGTYIEKIDEGIKDVSAALTANSPLPAGDTLKVTASFSNPAVGKTAHAVWYVDGRKISETDITFKDSGNQLTLTHKYAYTQNMALSSTVKLVLSYTTEDGEYQEKPFSLNVTLKNYDDSYYNRYNPDYVLKLVTSGYKGNWTTQWAIDHDYDARQKEIWVNAKGYYSNTNYLVWISTAAQHVNIFQGSKGNWKLIRSCLCGTGAPSTPTPITPAGVYWQITYKNAAGWTTSTYTCKPVVGFYGGGYAFHSRLYYPNSSTLKDPSIGYPISHGCIRMYDADIQYIYNNLPVGTRVVVY